MQIRPMEVTDGARILDIYAAGIATGNATFETDAPDWEAWDAGHVSGARFVAVVEDEVVGWSALVPSSTRCAYRGVAEASTYVAPQAQGKGIGLALLTALTRESEQLGYWTLLAGILRENTASIRLHEKAGFRIIGFNEKVGQLHGVWRDVIRLERRSRIVGS